MVTMIRIHSTALATVMRMLSILLMVRSTLTLTRNGISLIPTAQHSLTKPSHPSNLAVKVYFVPQFMR